MRFTKKLEETIHQYNLELIHTGRLGYPGSRYLDNELYFGWPKSNGQYVFEFNYFDHLTNSWLTFEKNVEIRKKLWKLKKENLIESSGILDNFILNLMGNVFFYLFDSDT